MSSSSGSEDERKEEKEEVKEEVKEVKEEVKEEKEEAKKEKEEVKEEKQEVTETMEEGKWKNAWKARLLPHQKFQELSPNQLWIIEGTLKNGIKRNMVPSTS